MDFSAFVREARLSLRRVTIPRFSPQDFCQTVERDRVTHTVLVPTLINLLTQFPELTKFRPYESGANCLRGIHHIAPELIHGVRKVLPHVKLVQGYGSSETGFLTGLLDHEHTENRLLSCGRPCPGIDVRVADEAEEELGRRRARRIGRGERECHARLQE